MAITIQQAPATLVTGFNDIIYVVSSNNSSQDNFQYICDIYITDDTGALTHAGQSYLREKVPAEPTYSSGVFNVGRKIESFLKYDIGDDTYGSQKCANSIIEIQLKFGEEYGPSSAITAYPNLTTASTIKAWNGIIDFPDIVDYAKAEFVNASANSTSRMLTDRPTSGTIRSDSNAWIYAVAEASNELKYMYVHTYNSSNNLLGSFKITNNFASITTTGRYMIRFPAGLRNLDLIPSADFDTSNFTVPPVSAGAVDHYEIFFANNNSQRVRASQFYKIDSSCTDHDVYTLHFWNKLGGFDTVSFIRAHTQDTNVVKKDKYKRNMITRIGGGRYGYNKRDLSDVQFYTQAKDQYKIISDWFKEEDFTWLEELITSPVVFHDHPTHGLVPIIITDTKHTHKQWRTDGLSNLEVTFEYGFDKYRQRQ